MKKSKHQVKLSILLVAILFMSMFYTYSEIIRAENLPTPENFVESDSLSTEIVSYEGETNITESINESETTGLSSDFSETGVQDFQLMADGNEDSFTYDFEGAPRVEGNDFVVDLTITVTRHLGDSPAKTIELQLFSYDKADAKIQ